MDWNDPAARGRLIERVGIDEYERQQAAHFRASTLAVVNGYGIRAVGSRFGTVYMVDGTGNGYTTLEAARAFATNQPAKV